nr:prolyl oligopeptidase family serine peptidase [candidate division Zixibacteria bacterium]
MDIDGIIRRREKVELNRAGQAAVRRLYDFDLLDRTIVESITYLSDGLHVNGYIARPIADGKYPVLVWNRGGSEDKGALDDLTAHLILASTARWGYIVLATQYRGNMGSEGDDEWGGDDLHDIHNIIKAAENIPECDTDRMAIEGASRGGMNTYRMLLEDDRFKCAIVHAGITDVPALMTARPDFARYIDRHYVGLSEEKKQEELEKLSAVHFAGNLPRHIPLLIMHGTADTVVPVEQSRALAAQLKKYNLPHKFVILEGGTHVALKDGSYREIDTHRREWLARYLA